MTLYPEIPGERLDAFLARCAENLSRSAAQKLIDEGHVLRNGKKAKKNDKLNPGDVIEYTIPEPKEVDILPTEMPLDIVYEDEDVLVINKPRGLLSIPQRGIRTIPWSTACSMPWGMTCPASTASCGPASSTASTKTPPVCWQWQKMTWLTRCWPPS